MTRRQLGAALTPGGYVFGVGGSQPGTSPAGFTTPGGVIAVQPGIGDAPATIAPSVTGYGPQPAAAGSLSSLTMFQEILIVLGVIGAIVLLPELLKK